MKTPILQTDQLILRPLRRSDADRLQELFPHYELLKYMSAAIPWPYPPDGAHQFLDSVLPEMEAETRHLWAITLKGPADDLLIGIIDLFPNNPNDNRGFWLGLEYHRRGYMREAVTAVHDFAFDVLELPHLMLNNAEPNVPSHRLKEKAGATIVEIRKDAPHVGGTFRNIQWKLTREQWHAHRDRFIARE